MTLKDIFNDAKTFYKFTHHEQSTPARRLIVKERNRFIAESIAKCIKECGPISDDPSEEFNIAMTYICTLDDALELATTTEKPA